MYNDILTESNFKEFFSSVKLIRNVYWRQKALDKTPLFTEGAELEMEGNRTAMILQRK